MHLESNTFCPHGGSLQFGEATLDHVKRSGNTATQATVVESFTQGKGTKRWPGL